jgi:hypothetical protein
MNEPDGKVLCGLQRSKLHVDPGIGSNNRIFPAIIS